MTRIIIIVTLAATLFAALPAAQAQRHDTIPVVGFLMP